MNFRNYLSKYRSAIAGFVFVNILWLTHAHSETGNKLAEIKATIFNSHCRSDDYENVIKKFFHFNSATNQYEMNSDYESIYPLSGQYNKYLGLKSEHSKVIRKHILLDFHCCKILNVCASVPTLITSIGTPFARCVCPDGSIGSWSNEICLKAYFKSSIYKHIIANP